MVLNEDANRASLILKGKMFEIETNDLEWIEKVFIYSSII